MVKTLQLSATGASKISSLFKNLRAAVCLARCVLFTNPLGLISCLLYLMLLYSQVSVLAVSCHPDPPWWSPAPNGIEGTIEWTEVFSAGRPASRSPRLPEKCSDLEGPQTEAAARREQREEEERAPPVNCWVWMAAIWARLTRWRHEGKEQECLQPAWEPIQTNK